MCEIFLKRILNRKERKEEMPQRAQRRNTAMRITAKNAKTKYRKERKEEFRGRKTVQRTQSIMLKYLSHQTIYNIARYIC